LLDRQVLTAVLSEQGLRPLHGKTSGKFTETLKGLSPLSGEMKGNPSPLALRPGKIFLKQLDSYELSVIGTV
jgi:hypothetical protein